MSFGNWIEDLVLDLLFYKRVLELNYIELALSRADPGEDGSGLDEPSGNGYARVLISFASWGNAADGILTNVLPIVFSEATGSWGQLTHFALYGEDVYASSGIIAYGPLDTPMSVVSGYMPRFNAGALRIRINGAGGLGSFSNYLENQMLEHLFQKSYYTTEAFYVGLCNANPGELATGADCEELPNIEGYARVETINADWYFALNGTIENRNDITFPIATDTWGIVTHFVILDSGVYGQGNVLVYGELWAPLFAASGSILRIPQLYLEVTID